MKGFRHIGTDSFPGSTRILNIHLQKGKNRNKGTRSPGREAGSKGLLIATFLYYHSWELEGDEDDGFVASLIPRIKLSHIAFGNFHPVAI
jgi:GH18 family chitinase